LKSFNDHVVRLWHIADIDLDPQHVYFQGADIDTASYQDIFVWLPRPEKIQGISVERPLPVACTNPLKH